MEREVPPFQMYFWHTEMNRAIFYVDDMAVAKALIKADRQIELPNCPKLILKVHAAYPPTQLHGPQLEQQRELMKLTMAKRYNAENKALDLSKFYADPALTDIYCGLALKKNMLTALSVIKQNIPDLEALKLDANKIFSLDTLRAVIVNLPNLKILHLANNKVRFLLVMMDSRLSFLSNMSSNLFIIDIYYRYELWETWIPCANPMSWIWC